MSVRLYMDVHIRLAVTDGLRLRGVDVLTSQEDGTEEFEDSDLLNRATELGRVLFTQDDDLLREANKKHQIGGIFAGVFYAHQLNISVGQTVLDLELLAKATEIEEWLNKIAYLPIG